MLKGACRRRTYRRRTRVEWSGVEWGGLAIHSFIQPMGMKRGRRAGGR